MTTTLRIILGKSMKKLAGSGVYWIAYTLFLLTGITVVVYLWITYSADQSNRVIVRDIAIILTVLVVTGGYHGAITFKKFCSLK